MRHRGRLRLLPGACALLILLAAPRVSVAQGFGAGPLTAALPSTEPTTGVLSLGRVRFAPGFAIEELGQDSNVFDERDNPKSDFVFRARPDVSAFTRVRFAQVSALVGSELAYYKKYSSERTAGLEYRGRLDILAGRLRPFVGGGRTRGRTRPNGEIDVRADRKLEEVSAGLGYEFGPHSRVFVSAVNYGISYFDAREEGVELATALNQNNQMYSLGVQTALTPFATLTVTGARQEDRFRHSHERDANRRIGRAAVQIAAEAVLSGFASIGYEDIAPTDPLVEPFRGVTGSAGLSYSLLEMGRFVLTFQRGMEYSFDVLEAYYKENSTELSYTHRLFGEVDVQLKGSLSLFDYGFRQGVAPRRDTLKAVSGSLGYNLRNRTRIALNYEWARRESPAFEERNYDRRRIFGSWMFPF